MAALILPSRRVVQPDGPVSIDWASPLTNGLTQAYRHGFGLYTQDAVSGAFVALSESTGMASSVSVAGKGITRAGSSTTLNQGHFTLPVTVPAGGDCTYLVVHSPNAATGNQGLLDDDNASTSRIFQFRLNAAATEFIWFNTAGSAFTASIASSVSAGALNVSLAVKRGSTLKVVNNGRISSSATITGTPRTQNSVLREFNRKGSTYSPYQGSHSFAAMWVRALSDAELIALSTNPWQLFKPVERRVWVPVSAGGGSASQTVAFTLDGISAAVAQVAGRTQSLSASLDGVTFSASQVAGHSQTLAATLDGVSFAAVQSVGGANSQSLAVTLDSVQFAASQTLGHAQSATVALDGVTFAASQTLRHSQSLAAVLDDLTFSAAQSASSPVKSQSLAVTLDDLQFYATQEGPAVAQGHGFVLVDFEPKLWWKRKPKALDEQEAAEKIASVARQIERVAVKQVKAGRVVQPVVSKPAKAEILQAIAPQLQQMPGFDPVELYRAILERLIQQEQDRQAELQAQQIAAQEIERIRLMELDEDETIILLMGA